jgi:hypothetical protein
LGSFAEIAASLISFCKKTEMTAYIRIAEAPETLDGLDAGFCCPTVDGLREAIERMAAVKEPL